MGPFADIELPSAPTLPSLPTTTVVKKAAPKPKAEKAPVEAKAPAPKKVKVKKAAKKLVKGPYDLDVTPSAEEVSEQGREFDFVCVQFN